VRLVDAVLRQGHLSEQALVEALMTGERPAHLDRCDVCAARAVELGRWLDDVRAVGIEAADRAFPPERLAAQQAQILRKLEQLDEPARVIAFPAASRTLGREAAGRRVAPAWVGVAAAAGLVLGVIGGQWSARLLQTLPAAPAVAVVQPPATAPVAEPLTLPSSIFDLDLDGPGAPSLAPINDLTPAMTTARAIRSGG
jgi:hypothetical protein